MTNGLFDKYGLQARLQPALLCLFPILLTAAVWTPSAYQLAASLVGLALACGLAVALAHLARVRGRSIENQLIKEWGELPTTIWLRHSDSHLEAETKKRYHRFLEQHVPDWKAPTPKRDETDRKSSDGRYGSAVRWLREYTRDTTRFPLVFRENISYGFRRNAFGLKPFAISISLVAVGLAMFGFYNSPSTIFLSDNIAKLSVAGVSLLLLLWWLFGVTRSWVRDAADAYARALLAACDAE